MAFQENEQIILNELRTTLAKLDPTVIQDAIDLINSCDKIFFYALGRAGFMGKSFVMRLMHMGREVYVMGETNTPNFGPNDLLIIASGSGETGQFVQMAEKAKNRLGGKLMVFTGTPGSTLDQMADVSIVIQAPSKKQETSSFCSIQPMASLFEQSILLTGDTIVLTMMENASNPAEMFSRHSNLE